MSQPIRTRVAVLGAGARAGTFIRALTAGRYPAALVAVGDPNPGRLDHYARVIAEAGHPAVARFAPDDLEAVLRDTGATVLLVATPDATHARYIERAVDAGADVVVEKPIAVTAEQTRRIARAVERTGRSVRLAFNYRYSPRNTEVKRLLTAGAIGRVTAVHFEWMLDTVHGADYFRRWHRDKDTSGGLLVHKSSHHFDLVNWWLDDRPARVFAAGGLRFYGEHGVVRDDDADGAGVRDRFDLAIDGDPTIRALYTDHAHHDGYTRNEDVFGAGITIEDTLGLVVEYGRRTTLTYSLTAQSPYEGYRVALTGTRGRIELDVVERSAVLVDSAGHTVIDPSLIREASAHDPVRPRGDLLRLQRHWESATVLELPEVTGSHGGADPLLLDDLFGGSVAEPELGRVSSHVDGIAAVAVGIAGNASLATGQAVDIADLDVGIEVGPARVGRTA
jgi:predicted dehydrogenase